MQDSRFLWVDCQDVAPEESRARFAALLTYLADYPDLIVCLDGLGSPCPRAEGRGYEQITLRGWQLRRPRRRIVGDPVAMGTLTSCWPPMPRFLDLCTRVRVPEPGEALTLDYRPPSLLGELRSRLSVPDFPLGAWNGIGHLVRPTYLEINAFPRRRSACWNGCAKMPRISESQRLVPTLRV